MASDNEELNQAWADVASRLPEGWELSGLRCASTGLGPDQRSEEWIAVATGPEGEELRHQSADPVTALRGLVADTR
jgi:hypothetical protein